MAEVNTEHHIWGVESGRRVFIFGVCFFLSSFRWQQLHTTPAELHVLHWQSMNGAELYWMRSHTQLPHAVRCAHHVRAPKSYIHRYRYIYCISETSSPRCRLPLNSRPGVHVSLPRYKQAGIIDITSSARYINCADGRCVLIIVYILKRSICTFRMILHIHSTLPSRSKNICRAPRHSFIFPPCSF